MPSDDDHQSRRTSDRLAVIGVANSKRVTAIVEAARRIGLTTEVVTYLQWIAGRLPPPRTLCRIESPGGCADTTRAILAAGISPMEERGAVPAGQQEISRLTCARGEMLHPLQWYLGYRRLLRRLEADGATLGARWMSHPSTIATTFDKLACLELWNSAGLPTPRRYEAVANYDLLRAAVQEPHARLFVKLRYGYSALGAMAMEWRDARIRAITTMESERSGDAARLFVTKRPRVITNEAEIAWLFDLLAKQEVVVEAWLPKARWNGRPYDVRAVIIGGRLSHVVGRANASPFTNLNLDATRLPRELVKEHLGAAWFDFKRLCEDAAGRICADGNPGRMLGLDVLIRPCRRRFALLEANAFGDYLPGLMHRGESTYEAELGACYADEVAA